MIDIAKIDVEGAEQTIIASVEEMMRNGSIRFLFVECEKKETGFHNVERILASCGYKTYFIVRDEAKVHRKWEDWNRYESRKPMNLVAIRETEMELFRSSGVVIH